MTYKSESLIPIGIRLSCCGTTRNRTGDTRIFSPLLYQLSYGTIVLRCKDRKIYLFCKQAAFFSSKKIEKRCLHAWCRYPGRLCRLSATDFMTQPSFLFVYALAVRHCSMGLHMPQMRYKMLSECTSGAFWSVKNKTNLVASAVKFIYLPNKTITANLFCEV